MGFELVPLQDAIVAQLQSVMPDTPFYEDGVWDDASLHRTPEGQLIPYIVPRFGSIRRRPLSYSIAGTRYDDYYSTVDVVCVAPMGRMARQMLDLAADTLIGFKPDDATEMTVEGYPDNFVVLNNIGRPAAYAATVRFRFGVNANNVAEHMTPPTP